jgi:hypothetical protein
MRNLPALILLALLLAPLTCQQPAHAQTTDCPQPLMLSEGDLITILGGVYIRANPAASAGIVSYAPDRIAARVRGGPVCANGIIWWQVERQFEEPTFLGWVAQSFEGRDLIFPPVGEPPKPCVPAFDLQIGQAISTFDGVKVRTLPSLQGRVLTTALPDSSALVVDGPACVDGFNWWLVDIEVAGVLIRGWIVQSVPLPAPENIAPVVNPNPDAEGDPNSPGCAPPAPLQQGARARLRLQPGDPLRNLRVGPTTISDVIVQLPSGIQLQIISEEPFCNQGQNWWQVQVFGGRVSPVGWVAEGDVLGRMIGPNGEDYGRSAP